MNNKIVVEGPDGSGKSSLCKALSLVLRLPMIDRHIKSSIEEPTDLWSWVMYDATRDSSGIYDRHPLIGEYVYGPILRNRLQDGFNTVMAAACRFKLMDSATTIICLPPPQVVVTNTRRSQGNQLEAIFQHQDQIYDKYLSVARDINAYVWDYTRPENGIRRING